MTMDRYNCQGHISEAKMVPADMGDYVLYEDVLKMFGEVEDGEYVRPTRVRRAESW